MYALKKTEDISFLVGATLLQICVGQNEIILNFDGSVRVTVLADFSIGSDHHPYARFDSPTIGSPHLFPLLGDSIVEAKATSSGGLKVIFKAGARVEIFDSNKEYESFWLQNGESTIVV